MVYYHLQHHRLIIKILNFERAKHRITNDNVYTRKKEHITKKKNINNNLE